MAPLRLSFLATTCAFFAGFAAASDSSVKWPENGAIKFGIPKSPSDLKLELPGCFSVSLNWGNDKVAVTKAEGSAETHLTGSERMRADGGQAVILMNLENGKVNVIVYPEAAGGGFDSRMASFDVGECPLTKLRVSSSKPSELKDITVSVSSEIEVLYRKAMGFTADEESG